jgi:hypothetical protein
MSRNVGWLTTRLYMPEDKILREERCDNLKPYTDTLILTDVLRGWKHASRGCTLSLNGSPLSGDIQSRRETQVSSKPIPC